MFCYFVRKKFSFYYDGEIPEKEKKKIEIHLKKCQSCQKEYRAFEENLKFLKSNFFLSAPDYLWEKIERKIDQNAKAVCQEINFYKYFLRLGIVFVCIFIILIFSYRIYYFNSSKKLEKNIEFLINSQNLTENFELDIETEYDLILNRKEVKK